METKQTSLLHSLLLLLAALIWGVAFVAQSSGGDALGAYTFNSLRSIIGSIALIPVISFFGKGQKQEKNEAAENTEKRTLMIGGLVCGTLLCVATNLQQLALCMGSPAGKAGFLTACYILLVPVLGMLFGKKNPWNIWLGIVIAVAGLYLLCMKGSSMTFQPSDILLLGCSLTFAVHIMVVAYFSPKVNGIKLSCIQFAVCGLLTAVPMIAVEIIPQGVGEWMSQFNTEGAWIALLYAGIMSRGIAYTLQIIGQAKVQETIASMIMSLESVFSVLAGWILLGQILSMREIAGCVCIFIAVILAQLDFSALQAGK